MSFKYILNLLFIILLVVLGCVEKENCELNNNKINKLFSEKIETKSVKLLPASNYDFIFRYTEQNNPIVGEYTLTILENSGNYYLQLIYAKNVTQSNLERTSSLRISEKMLNDIQKNMFKSKLEKLFRYESTNFDENFISTSRSYFEILVKEKNKSRFFIGLPSFFSESINSKWEINEKKKEVLSFVGWLLNISKMGKNKKVIIKKVNRDSVDYSVFIDFYQHVVGYKIYFEKKEITLIDGVGKLVLPLNDTANLINRIKVIETRWDGEVIEY